MQFALVLRKLKINNNIYYQIIDKVIGENDQDSLYVTEGDKFINTYLNSIDSLDDLVYLEINKSSYDSFKLDNQVLKLENDELISIDDLTEENNVLKAFYDTFKDFSLIPSYDILKLANLAYDNIKQKVIGQDEIIKKIINKLYNNYMFYNTDLEIDEIVKNKSNILVMGPIGCGKTSLKNILKKNFYPIPIIEYTLTGNFNQDIKNIIQKLIMVANGNKFLASQGIVVFDNIDSHIEEDEYGENLNNNLLELKKIINSKIICLYDQNHNGLTFDCSLLTTICFIDTEYDYADRDNNYYQLVSNETLSDLGFSTDLLEDCFDGEIIYMNEMTDDLAKKILQDKNISPLYQYKLSFEKQGKKVRFSPDFVQDLIEYGLEEDFGFTGILKTFKQIAQSKDINDKVITFDTSDFDNLSIGTYLPDDDCEILKNDEDLKIDLEKKTINNKTLKDTVNLIKENIKGQDSQVFAIVNAFYKHTFNRYKKFNKFEISQLKENVLLIGSTGVGKTAIVENLARIFNLPYKREIAPRYSKSGYVGESVDSIITDLIEVANGDIKKAQNGILFLDEIDKIRATGDNLDMGLSVQNELLTLIEGDKRTVNDKNNSYFLTNREFDTTNLFVYAAGAFSGLDEITKRRVKKERGKTVGFKTDSEDNITTTTTMEDLVTYGMDMQFIGRLPNIVNLNILSEDTLYEIVNSESGYVNLNKKSYSMDGIEIEMNDGFKKELARKAFLDKKGARSIKTIFAKLKSEIDYKIMLDEYQKVILNEKSLDDYNSIVYVKKR